MITIEVQKQIAEKVERQVLAAKFFYRFDSESVKVWERRAALQRESIEWFDYMLRKGVH